MKFPKNKILLDVIVYIAFVLFYVVAYRDFLFEKSLVWVLNLMPLPTSNPRFYIPGQLYWYPGSLGCPAQPNIANWLPYIIVLLTGGNLVLAEKILASTTLLSSITMYYFLSKHFKLPRISCFIAALVYGFGPATVLNFADITHWGYVTIPFIFHYMLNILEGEGKIKDNIKNSILLGLSISFTIAFLPHLLLLIIFTFLIFLITYTLLTSKGVKILLRMSLLFSLATLIFIVTSPYVINGAYQLLILLGWLPPLPFISHPTILPSSVQSELFHITYANQNIPNIIRLIGGSPGNHLREDNWLGFVLPVLAFSSLILARRGRERLNVLSLTLISVIIFSIIYGIHVKADWAMWLLFHTPVILFHYPERPLYIVSFAYSVMISVTIGRLLDLIYNSQSLNLLLKHLLSIFLISLILGSIFMFAPVFDTQIHQERYHPLPQLYYFIREWLWSQKIYEGDYRVMFLPTDFFSIILGIPDVFEATPGYATIHALNYVRYTYDELVNGKLHNLGSLIAPASVKYIILSTPNVSALWPGTSAQRAALAPQWDLQGEPRYREGVLEPAMVQGDPRKLAEILSSQMDLKLVYIGNEFRVYENQKFIPKISVFLNAAYVIGSEKIWYYLQYLPFNITDTLLIFDQQNSNLSDVLIPASSLIIFFNSDFSNLRIQNKNFLNKIIDKKQVYLITQNSSKLSKLLSIPPGQYYLALKILDKDIIMNDICEESFIIEFDGIRISSAQSAVEGGWRVYGPINVNNFNVRNLTISRVCDKNLEVLVAIYNNQKSDEIFKDENNITNYFNYSFSKISDTNYMINLNTTRPVFITLSESFYPDWIAYTNEEIFLHFVAFSFSNGFYINRTGLMNITIKYLPPLINYFYIVQQLLFVLTLMFIIILHNIDKIKEKLKKY
jgi:hypothetical protein